MNLGLKLIGPTYLKWVNSSMQVCTKHPSSWSLVLITANVAHSVKEKVPCDCHCTHGSKISCKDIPSFYVCAMGCSQINVSNLTADILMDQCSQQAEPVLDAWVQGIRMWTPPSYPMWLIACTLCSLFQPFTSWAPVNCEKLAEQIHLKILCSNFQIGRTKDCKQLSTFDVQALLHLWSEGSCDRRRKKRIQTRCKTLEKAPSAGTL